MWDQDCRCPDARRPHFTIFQGNGCAFGELPNVTHVYGFLHTQGARCVLSACGGEAPSQHQSFQFWPFGAAPWPHTHPPSQQNAVEALRNGDARGAAKGKTATGGWERSSCPLSLPRRAGVPVSCGRPVTTQGHLDSPVDPIHSGQSLLLPAPPAVLSDVPTLTETSQEPHSPPHRLQQGCSYALIPCDLTRSQGAGK